MLFKKLMWTTLLALAVLALPAAGLSILASQPTLFYADGGVPAPDPIPLPPAQPTLLYADGVIPEPPIPPTAQPTLFYADGVIPEPPIPPTANV
ncbi:MAG TPA: hypothetical protein VHM88_12855 [Candidatus Acidoferrales bacterium]|nr:hypothetical protein [Candidatus Acidoferrales bacterium]